MKELMDKARKILVEWKGNSYAFGDGALKKVGVFAKPLGRKALLAVADLEQQWVEPARKEVVNSLKEQGVA